MIPERVQTLIQQFPLGCLATVSPEGKPMVSPKGTFLVLDDRRLGYGDIRSPGSTANLAQCPDCEVVFVDPFKRKGARIAGLAQVLPGDSAAFAALIPRWRDAWGDFADRIKALVVIDVTQVLPLATPPYDDGVSEDEMIALYKRKFAEIYP